MTGSHPTEKHEAVMADHETRIQTLEKGAAVREEQYRNLYISVGKIERMIEDIRNDVQSAVNPAVVVNLETRLGKLEAKPGKKWESLEAIALTALVGGAIGFALSRLLGA